MEKLKKAAKIIIKKYGGVIAGCAFAFVMIAANSACSIPYYEPEEPQDLSKFKKFR